MTAENIVEGTMTHSTLEVALLQRLRARGLPAAGIGIDLGTTKSSVACARFDPGTGALTCETVRYPQFDGTQRIAVPSVIALAGDRTLFGAEALAQRGTAMMRPERTLFYETKNQMGLRYTYARAPETFRSPTDIATHLLRHLRTGLPPALTEDPGVPVVVTVPASFHGAQRLATVRAAERAFDREAGTGTIRLLDEPYAAFIDLKFRSPEQAAGILREAARVLVFDFGGGTCDVAIFCIDAVHGESLGARLLGTSRYHRLGGGDIDRAIVHDVLIPALIAENGLDRHAMSWFDKRKTLEPQLLTTAEHLKIALSATLAAHKGAGLDPDADLAACRMPIEVTWRDRTLRLKCPALTYARLKALMKEFLDPDPPPEAGDEFVQRSSIFAPVVQALLRARLDPDDIHGVLLCGSSSLMPMIQSALAQRFPGAQHVVLGDAETLQGTVARGAALQALCLQAQGEPLVAPVSSADLSLRVTSGHVPLIKAGQRVPSRAMTPTLLRPARESRSEATELAIEILAEGQRLVGRSLWTLPPPVSTADRLALDWRLDDNQCVELRLSRLEHPDTEPFLHRFDAPIMHRDPGQLVRCRLLEREEAIRNDEIPREAFGEAFEEHARDCAALGEYEKALHFVSLAMQEKGETNFLLNLRGIYRERIGDRDGALDSYLRAKEWPTARFNIALHRYRAEDLEQALEDIDEALDAEPARAYHALRGDILEKMGSHDQARLEWQDAVAGSPDWSCLDDFELGWIERAARKLNDSALVDRIREERARCARKRANAPRQGELPEHVHGDLLPRPQS
jgi:molecular chaperone DnaK (HSP70)